MSTTSNIWAVIGLTYSVELIATSPVSVTPAPFALAISAQPTSIVSMAFCAQAR